MKNKETGSTEFNEIRKNLGNFDLVLPGTIRKLHMKCGKSGCVCQTDMGAKHGPYYLWDRKVGKKLTSKMVPSNMIPILKNGIENRKALEKLVQEAIKIGQEMAVELIENEKKRRHEIGK